MSSKSDKDFETWLMETLKKNHGDNFDQKIADKMLSDLLKKKKDDDLTYGALMEMVKCGGKKDD